MTSRSSLLAVGLVVVFAAGGCGSSGESSGPPSNVPPGDTLGQLSTSQVTSLCDYLADTQGGYGRSVNCPAGDTQTTDSSQSECVSSSAGVAAVCPTLTVGETEACAVAVGTSLCDFDTDSACAPVRDCITAASAGGAN
jgi:hypothetical protein